MIKVEKIYFDMDGVLADFNKGVEEFCGIEALDQSNKTPTQDDVMWEAVSKVEHFYDKLPQLEGAKEMYESIAEAYGADRCEILSGIPKPRRGILTAGEDKTSWAHREIDENLRVNIVYREEKKKYAIDSNYILIDDYEKNIKEWEDCGGTGILFTTPENVLRALGLRD